MMIPRPALERRVQPPLVDAAPSRIPVLLGGCGTGRTSLLRDLRDADRAEHCQYVDVERAATTPERFHRALCLAVAVPAPATCRCATPTPRARRSTRRSRFSTRRRAQRTAAGDVPARRGPRVPHVRELPGAAPRPARPARRARDERQPVRAHDAVRRRRALRLLRDAPPRFEVIHVPPLDSGELRQALRRPPVRPRRRGDLRAPSTRSPTGTRATPTRSSPTMSELSRHGGSDPVSALAAACRARRPARLARAASATSCACTARAGTARSRPSSASSPKRSRSR